MGEDRRLLVEQLMRHEGVRLTVYKDPLGIETLGVGRNVRDKGISHAEAMMLLDHDLDECITDLSGSFPWFLDLDPVRQRVMIDMRFQLGPTRFRGFKRLLRKMSEGDYVLAGASMRESLWAKQVPSRAQRLVRWMLTGVDDW